MPNWNKETSKNIAEKALQTIGESNRKLSLIRLGENAIFNVEDCPFILRIHRKNKNLNDLISEIDITNYLQKTGFHSNAIYNVGNTQPLLVDGHYVTIWKKIIYDSSIKIDWKGFGVLIKEFHEKMANYKGQLMAYDPFKKIDQRICAVRNLSESNSNYLDELEKLSHNLKLSFDENLKCTNDVIHGDAHSGNILISEGNLYLIDYENVSRGNRYWDIIPLCVTVKRMGMDESYLNSFLIGYGYEIREWEHYELAIRIRELYMTMWLYQNVDNNPQIKKEIDIRMEGLLGGDKEKKWTAF